MFKNAVFWFVGLFFILLAGFWPSYYSNILSEKLTFEQHLHGGFMTFWVFLLIAQAWLIRDRKNATHKKLGRVSFLLAPLVVISGLYVNVESTAKSLVAAPEPSLAFFWLGYSDILIFALLWSLAIKHRKNMQLHARYMMTTGMVFIMPGLGRLLGRLFEISFDYSLIIPALFALALTAFEWRKGKVWRPFPLFAGLWLGVFIGFHLLPHSSIWKSIAEFHVALIG